MKRYSSDERKDLLKRFRSSGLSCPAFCKRNDIAYSTFYSWLSDDGATASNCTARRGDLVEVAALTGANERASFVVTLPSGLCVDFPLCSKMEQLALFCREVSGC